ncbi:MAG: DUF2254 domain-containing protein, partial [Acidimicrobiia bacterium]|nr:DUF2254 domain-containing protein [Acidimicrobiia bacterium]
PGEVEIVLLVTMGSYVAFADTIAEVRGSTGEATNKIVEAVQHAIQLERTRDITKDPGYGIEQLETIAWTSISTAKSNPAPGLLAIRSLRELLARWSVEEERPMREEEPLPVVYSDGVMAQLMSAFESLAVVSSESMQHQSFAEVIRTLATLFDRLPLPQQRQTEDLIPRIISALGDHVLTTQLDDALISLVQALRSAGRHPLATTVQATRDDLAASLGKLNARGTRAQGR